MGKHESTNIQTKKRTLKESELKKIIIAMILVLFALIFIDRAQEKTIDTENLSLIINNKDITTDLKDPIIEQSGSIYLSFEDIKNIFDETIYVEPETGLIITTSTRKVASLNVDSTFLEINGSNLEMKVPVFKTEQEKIYLPISEMANVYDIEFAYIDKTKNVIIDYYSKGLKKATVTSDSSVKNSKSKLSKTIDNVSKDDIVVLINQKDGWAKIRTQNGMIGYIKDKNVTNIETVREDFEENNISVEGNALQKDITNLDIENYVNRKSVINNIITETITTGNKAVKIIYNGDQKAEKFERFKIESKPILKEVGISINFD